MKSYKKPFDKKSFITKKIIKAKHLKTLREKDHSFLDG